MTAQQVTVDIVQSLIPQCSNSSTGIVSATLKVRHKQSNDEDHITNSSALCSICQSISFSAMRGPNLDRMQPHQPSYLALKLSAEAGCCLCNFFCVALSIGGEHNGDESAAAWASVSPKYPGREISLVGWGGFGSQFDRIYIITTGEIPEPEDSDDDDVSDQTMHPQHQIALQGTVQIYAHESMYLKRESC
jgi:hypothetical protein